MRRLFRSATVVDRGRERDGTARVVDILVDGDRICRIADRLEEGVSDAEILDASRFLVTPGLVNAHGHLAMTLLRGFADGVPLEVWLEKYMFPREARMTGEDIYFGTLLALAEGIMCGTTTYADMYFCEDDVAHAVDEAGIRANLSTGTAASGDESRKLRDADEFFHRWNGASNGRIMASFGPHAPYTTTPDFIREMFVHAKSLGAVVQFHLHETRKEVDDFTARYGASPIVYYAHMGLFDDPPALLAAHCVHMTPEDVRILHGAGAGIALNIQSNLKLGSGIPDCRLLLESGINLCIGTDGAGSNDNLDMLEELRVLGLVMKGSTRDPVRVGNERLLSMATVNGACALGFNGVGTLTEGSQADLVFWDLQDESFYPHNNLASHLIWSASSRSVDSVMVAGSWVMKHREFMHLDIEKVRFETDRRARRLAGA